MFKFIHYRERIAANSTKIIKSYRTKRRKIQNDHKLLNESKTCFSIQNVNQIVELFINQKKNKNQPVDDLYKYNDVLVQINENSNFSKNSEKITDSNCSNTIKNEVDKCSINNEKKPLHIKLKHWALECYDPHSTLDKLLPILKNEEDYKSFQKLPLNSRTLLNSGSSATKNILNIYPGIYYHFGLSYGINRHLLKFKHEDNEIKIVQFWPLLAYVYPHSNNIFPIEIYHGNSKPNDSNNYLKYFIEEAKYLTKNGIELNGNLFKVSIMAFCCDSPAKSFILKIKSHTGFSSCTRCYHEGEYFQNRICFPYQENSCKMRDHCGYVTMIQKSHHLREGVTSDLTELSNFDMVQSFPLDYMHLVLLGAMRKLIHLWMSKGPVTVRLHNRQIAKISELLLGLRQFIPIEFARKPRSFEDICRWKATELRQFLLHTGPIVLKTFLSEVCYKNIMLLIIAMTILLSSNHKNNLRFTDYLLNYFVQSFGNMYGQHFISHNIHGLLHIVEDYKRFGPFDSCSCFPFENYLQFLKSAVRKPNKPLQQIVRKYKEENTVIASNTPICQTMHDNGLMIEKITCSPQFSLIKLQTFSINVATCSDTYI
ncbi:hypothetical protein AGLY_017488 [Aphis glycines]|uniref:Transposase domain-containing protein n=1 Tax=Aphis glycines TaxID=307491 RepID=A0A6G0SUN4_APHGL|nr:hypothetical protein AGLY_017488 [Aphis glycines]